MTTVKALGGLGKRSAEPTSQVGSDQKLAELSALLGRVGKRALMRDD